MPHGGQLTMRDDPQLAARILAAIPASEHAFVTLLGLLRIGASDDIATACVTLGARSRLMVNPGFVQRYCATDEALATLVMHELYHVLLGHTRLFARATPLDNLAFDAVINAHLAQRFPAPGRLALFKATYAADELPGALLRPPDGWPDAPQWPLAGQLGALHRRLYTPEGGTCLEVYEALKATLPRIEVNLTDLLGSHGEGSHGDGERDTQGDTRGDSARRPSLDPELRKILDDIVARWPAARELGGRDAGMGAAELDMPACAAPKPLAHAVRAAVIQVAGDVVPVSAGGNLDGLGSTVAPYRSRPTAREIGLEIVGETPLFFATEVLRPRLARRDKVHLYLDVSGSMAPQLPAVAGAVISVQQLLVPAIHAFSTEVHDVDAVQLRRGNVLSTRGTSIACVAEHMVTHGVRRAVIVTDGEVGDVPEPLAEKLLQRRLRIHAVVTSTQHAQFVDQLGGKATLCDPWRTR